jgi:hypothetical protein
MQRAHSLHAGIVQRGADLLDKPLRLAYELE